MQRAGCREMPHSTAALLGFVPTLQNSSSKMLQLLAWMSSCLTPHSHCTQVAVECLCCPSFGGNLQVNKKVFSTWAAVLMPLAAFHCFISNLLAYLLKKY